jgi:hypothetical protein
MELTMINLVIYGKHFKPKCANLALGVKMNVKILEKGRQQVQSDSIIV